MNGNRARRPAQDPLKTRSGRLSASPGAQKKDFPYRFSTDMMLSSMVRSAAVIARAAQPVLRGVLPTAARAVPRVSSLHLSTSAGGAGRGGRAALGGAVAATGVAATVAWLEHQAAVAGCEEAEVADEIMWDFVSAKFTTAPLLYPLDIDMTALCRASNLFSGIPAVMFLVLRPESDVGLTTSAARRLRRGAFTRWGAEGQRSLST